MRVVLIFIFILASSWFSYEMGYCSGRIETAERYLKVIKDTCK